MTIIIVKGTPKSIQAHSLASWKAEVVAAARQVFSSPLTAENITVRIAVYYNKLPTFDTDNISKPIVDALQGIAYDDDSQVMERRAIKKTLDGSYRIKGVDPKLVVAMAEGVDFVCIEVRELSKEEVERLS